MSKHSAGEFVNLRNGDALPPEWHPRGARGFYPREQTEESHFPPANRFAVIWACSHRAFAIAT